MGHSHGFPWAKYKDEFRDLIVRGHSNHEIASILSERHGHNLSFDAIDSAKKRMRFTNKFIGLDGDITVFDELHLPMDNYGIFCDVHAPAHNAYYVNLFMSLCIKHKIKRAISVGDLFSFDAVSRYFQEDRPKLDWEIEKSKPVVDALKYFDKVTLLQGNHERRVGIYTEEKIRAKHLFALFGKEAWDKKFKFSVYDKLTIGDDWMCVHPKSYSQIGGNVAIKLADKFQKNVINAHGHFVALRYNRSGKHMGIDLGGLFDKDRISYINMSTTTHPVWNNGFGLMIDGHFHLFHGKTDFKRWL